MFFTDVNGNPQFSGTGTVIDNRNVNGQGYFCVLTADHVIANGGPTGNVKNGLGIAFGNLNGFDATYFPGNSNFLAANLVGRLGPGANPTVDMAVLSVNYGAYNAGYSKFTLGLSGANQLGIGSLFSSDGFGRPATPLIEANQRPGGIPSNGMWWNGYVGQPVDYYQRFIYNRVDALPNIDDNFLADTTDGSVVPYGGDQPADNPRQGYAYSGAQWDLTSPDNPNVVNGEGITRGGDSGAPYLLSVGNSQLIAGIHTYGYSLIENGQTSQKVPWGFQVMGVLLTPAYQTWIQQQCASVPEPCSLLAMAGGLALLAKRRTRRK